MFLISDTAAIFYKTKLKIIRSMYYCASFIYKINQLSQTQIWYINIIDISTSTFYNTNTYLRNSINKFIVINLGNSR